MNKDHEWVLREKCQSILKKIWCCLTPNPLRVYLDKFLKAMNTAFLSEAKDHKDPNRGLPYWFIANKHTWPLRINHPTNFKEKIKNNHKASQIKALEYLEGNLTYI